MAYLVVCHFSLQKQLEFQIVGKSLESNHIYKVEAYRMFLAETNERGYNGFRERLSD